MNDALADIREKLQAGSYQNEEHVRLSLVARLLQELGWDIWNPAEVNTEFLPVPTEDKTKVDLALFSTPRTPSVFIEVKAVDRISNLEEIERQLRDYNRNNTALFSIITDGRKWRFYYSQTGGQFSKKCFKILNLSSDEPEDLERTLHLFLSKSEIDSGNAKKQAEALLQLTQKERVMEECLSKAVRLIQEAPFPTLPDALLTLVAEQGFEIPREEAERFVKKQSVKPEPPPPPVLPPPSEPDYVRLYRRQLKNPNSLPSRIKQYIEQKRSVTRGELKGVCVERFGCKSKTSGSIGACIKMLEGDGYIKVDGRGDSAMIISLPNRREP